MAPENVDIEVEVEDWHGELRRFNILEFTYHQSVRTIIAFDPGDDQIGDPGGFEDVVCKWQDTGALFTDTDWDRYADTIYDALNDYLNAGRDYDNED